MHMRYLRAQPTTRPIPPQNLLRHAARVIESSSHCPCAPPQTSAKPDRRVFRASWPPPPAIAKASAMRSRFFPRRRAQARAKAAPAVGRAARRQPTKVISSVRVPHHPRLDWLRRSSRQNGALDHGRRQCGGMAVHDRSPLLDLHGRRRLLRLHSPLPAAPTMQHRPSSRRWTCS